MALRCRLSDRSNAYGSMVSSGVAVTRAGPLKLEDFAPPRPLLGNDQTVYTLLS
jgi:hypothetical protein